MSRVRGKDTGPEMVVRKLVHGMGFRYRLHVRGLPGAPDLVFSKLRKVIFVHGCFWHRHQNCQLARLPKSKLDFWIPKLNSNRERDAENTKTLRKNGWKVKIIWECQLKNSNQVQKSVARFLDS
jgi:DNA mismatch endonuclease (patch repair protein)